MPRYASLCGVASLLAIGFAPGMALAQGGPCSDDIAALSRQFGTQVGLGAPVSQPDYGQKSGPADASAQKADANADARQAKAAGSADTDKAQKGGASRETGGSAGTVGGVAGPTAPMGQADAIATGRIATSPDDVRRQSDNRPTAAAAAAAGGDPKAASQASTEDKVSQAKAALQRAVDLNAKGDGGCREAVKQARDLAPAQAKLTSHGLAGQKPASP